ncbi:MAG: helix-turn-helix domain-containing protein [Alphaproteobacteria bacterium]|nr:helix-turn-helix domain-containing protein [Alphaproteobacteria bacterium]
MQTKRAQNDVRDLIAVAPAEAARIAGLGRSTLYLALRSGDLPSLKLGRRRLIRLDALTAWLNSHAA